MRTVVFYTRAAVSLEGYFRTIAIWLVTGISQRLRKLECKPTMHALEQFEDIAKVGGVDGVFFRPADLSADMGMVLPLLPVDRM